MASPFKFYKIRSGVETQFQAGAGTRLRFANKAADSLDLPGLPRGSLASGDKVKVKYNDTTVFLGDVSEIVERAGRGDDATDTVVVKGPWDKMARLVYRQNWKVSNGYKKSSRIVLNQHQSGSAQNLNSELAEIAADAASACGYSLGTVSVSSQYLPFDEVRDLTIADAIRRELRFFPRTVARFDYSQTTPALSIVRIAKNGSDAAYVASVPKAARQKRYTANPVTGVDIEIETVGDGYRDISHQTAGNTSAGNPNCLYATIQLAGATSSIVTQSFESVTEDIPSNLSDQAWWMAKHPRLRGLATAQVAISDGARSDSGESVQYPRLASATAGEIEAAGLKCRVVEFTCKATITTDDDVESDILLSMKFLTTNATTKTYTWIVSSSATAGDTCPSGLAAAILADRSGSLVAERMTIRLGSSLPQLGDLCDDLPLQSFEVDCTALTAELEFGAPEHLAPEDMASLLSGFRNKRRPTVSVSRATGKVSDLAAASEAGAIMPIWTSEWAPGTKSKTTVKALSGSSGKIALDASHVPSGSVINASRVFTFDDVEVAQIMADEDIDVGTKEILAGPGVDVEDDGETITISADISLAAGPGVVIDEDGKVSVNADGKSIGIVAGSGNARKVQLLGFDSPATNATSDTLGEALTQSNPSSTRYVVLAVPASGGFTVKYMPLDQIAVDADSHSGLAFAAVVENNAPVLRLDWDGRAAGDTIALRELVVYGSDGTAQATIKVPASANVAVPGVKAGRGVSVVSDDNGHTRRIDATVADVQSDSTEIGVTRDANGVVHLSFNGSGGGSGGGGSDEGYSGSIKSCIGLAYNVSTHQFTATFMSYTVSNGLIMSGPTSSVETVFTAVEETV